MIEYVCGFLFDRAREHVWLIRKNRPAWQAGKLNGIGGKVEPGEFVPRFAMVREFAEETGFMIDSWRAVAVLTDQAMSRRVSFFAAEAGRALFARPGSMTDEAVAVYPVAELWGRADLLPNLRLPLALAHDRSGLVMPVLLEDRGPNAGLPL